MKHRCVRCHFLAKKALKKRAEDIDVVTRTDRKRMLQHECQLEDEVLFYCHKKVWDERIDLGMKDRAYNIIEKERQGQCFFYAYKPNMTFETAEYLQENTPQPPAEGPTLLGDRSWLIWIVSILVMAVSIVYVLESA